MIISYKIPNGHMRIAAGVFFQQATKPKIKRMFKQLRDSSPPQEFVSEIRNWLQGQSAIAEELEIEAAIEHNSSREMLAKSEELYERMRSPRDGIYTRDKDVLEKAMTRIIYCRRECNKLKSDFTEAQKTRERYESIVVDMDKIFSM